MLREVLERWGLQLYLKLSDLSEISEMLIQQYGTKNQGSNSEMSSPDNFTTEDPPTLEKH